MFLLVPRRTGKAGLGTHQSTPHETGTAARPSPMPRSPLIQVDGAGGAGRGDAAMGSAGRGDIAMGSAGRGDAGGFCRRRCMCRQCRQGCGQAGTSRWLPWLSDGLLLPGKAPQAATPNTRRAAGHMDLQTPVPLSRRQAGRCLCLRFTGSDPAYPLLCLTLGLCCFSLCEEGLKGAEMVCAPRRCTGDRSWLHSVPGLLHLWSLPGSKTSECYLNVRGGFFSARQSKGKQIQLFRIPKPSLCPSWLLLPSTIYSLPLVRRGMLRWATEGRRAPQPRSAWG